MKIRSAMAALAVVVVLAAPQVAAAGRLSTEPVARGTEAVWNPVRIEAAGREAACPITLGGDIETASIAKRSGTRFGVVDEAALGSCTRNTATVLRETLPWSMTYSSFAGTLPSITSVTVNVIGLAMRVNLEGIECLFTTRSEQPARGIATLRRETSGALVPTEIRADETTGIETSGGFLCSIAGRGHFVGTGRLTSRIAISLI